MAVIRAKQQFPEEYIHPKGINYNLNLQFAFIPSFSYDFRTRPYQAIAPSTTIGR